MLEKCPIRNDGGKSMLDPKHGGEKRTFGLGKYTKIV